MIRLWRAGLAKIGVRTDFGRDVVGTLLLILIQVGNLLTTFNLEISTQELPEPISGPPVGSLLFWGITLLTVISIVPVAWRRRAPTVAFLISVTCEVAAFATEVMFSSQPMVSGQFWGSVFLAYAVAAYRPRGIAVGVIAAGLAVQLGGLFAVGIPQMLVALVAVEEGIAMSPALLYMLVAAGSLFALGVPALLGGYVQQRRAYVDELRARAEQAELEREARAATAVAEERGRIARELHDIAAHHLSGIVVQAGAAERQIDHDPGAAKETITAIRTQGKRTLANMRLVVGVLRTHDDAEGAPQPGLADARPLIAEASAAGAQISYEVHGTPRHLGPTTDLTAYRILQEALSNARAHAPGAAITVRLDYTDESVTLEVRNDPPPAGPLPGSESGGGHGLVGMRERATLVSGTLEAGPTEDGGWSVRLELPGGGA